MRKMSAEWYNRSSSEKGRTRSISLRLGSARHSRYLSLSRGEISDLITNSRFLYFRLRMVKASRTSLPPLISNAPERLAEPTKSKPILSPAGFLMNSFGWTARGRISIFCSNLEQSKSDMSVFRENSHAHKIFLQY